MKKHEAATEQLHAILKELGEHDYLWFLNEIDQIDRLENPDPKGREEIEAIWSGTWEDFKTIWKAYHLCRISKKLSRKFEKIAKNFSNFDTLLEELATTSARTTNNEKK